MAPLSVLRLLLEEGIRPLYAEMEGTEENAEVVKHRKNGRIDGFRFVRFIRLTKIEVFYEEM